MALRSSPSVRTHSLVLALVVSACGSGAPTSAPSSIAAAGSVAPVATPTGGASATLLPSLVAPSLPATASIAPSTDPGPSSAPSAPASSWRTVVPPLAVPAAYLDFGFAGNGDLIAIGTDDVTDPKLGLWVARYSPDGTRQSKKALDRRITSYAGDWIDIDPTNDSVVISERDAGTTTLTGRRFSSANGKTSGTIDFHKEVRRIAIDDDGRMFAITPFYGTLKSRVPCMVDRLTAAGAIAGGVDHWLETCETIVALEADPPTFGDLVAIEVGRDGRLLLIDESEVERERIDGTRGLAFTVLTTGFDLVRHWPVPLEFEQTDPPFGPWSQSTSMAGSANGDLYLGEVIIAADGTRSTGFRIRWFDRTGSLRGTLGVGGDQAGVTFPMFPNIDADGRLWVIDLDTATRSYSIKVRE